MFLASMVDRQEEHIERAAGIHRKATQDNTALMVGGALQHCGNSDVNNPRPGRAPRYTDRRRRDTQF
jgi:hypothetical protein